MQMPMKNVYNCPRHGGTLVAIEISAVVIQVSL